MNYALAALLSLPLCVLSTGCLATSAALDSLSERALALEERVAQQQAVLQDASAVLADPLATPEQIDAAVARVKQEVAAVKQEVQATKGAFQDLRDGVKSDMSQIGERIEMGAAGLTGFGVEGDGGLISLGIGAALWLLRDWRKRKGNDPVTKQVEERLSAAEKAAHGTLNAALAFLAQAQTQAKSASGKNNPPGADPPAPFTTG